MEAAGKEIAGIDMNICFQCGLVCENSVSYCHSCYEQRSESDFRNEQRWRNAESDLQVVESNLQKERSLTQRLEATLSSYREMLLHGIHADVTIETGEIDKTPAHRAILRSLLLRICVYCLGFACCFIPFRRKNSHISCFREAHDVRRHADSEPVTTTLPSARR